MSQEQAELEDRTPSHPPEVVTAAMEVERERLEREAPATAAALREAARKDRSAGAENAERLLVEEAVAVAQNGAKPGRPKALSEPRPVRLPAKTRQRASRSRRTTSPIPSPSPVEASSEDGPSLNVRERLEDLAEAGQAGARRKTLPNEDNWTDFLAVLFGLFSLLFIWWVTSGVGPMARQEREALELEDEEAEGLARPAARIIARSFLNERYGKHAMGLTDYVVMAVVLVGYAERVSPAVKRKLEASVPRRERPKEEARGRTKPAVVEEQARGPAGPQQFVLGAGAT